MTSIPSPPESASSDGLPSAEECRFLHAMAEHAPVGLAICDRQRRLVFANRTYAEILGRTVSEILGRSVLELLGPPHDALVAGQLDIAFSGRRNVYESTRPGPEGLRYYHIIQEPLLKDGRVEQVVAVITDVTERRRGEIAAGKLAAIVESSDDAMVGEDLEGRVTSWNKGAENMVGYTADEMIGQSVERLLPPGRNKEDAEILQAIRRGEKLSHFETQRRTKDGRVIDVSITASPIRDASGKVVGLSKVARDITSRLRNSAALQLFRALLDQSNDSIEVIDPASGRFLDVNDKALHELGYTREEHLALHLWDIDPAVTAEGWPDKVERIRNTGRATGEGVHRRKDGSTFPIEYSTKLVRLEREYIVAIVRDITRRREAEAALQVSNRFLSDLIEHSGSLVFAKDREGRYQMVNRKWEEVSGLRREKVLGARDEELFSPTDAAGFRSIDQEVIESGESRTVEEFLHDASGERSFLSVKFPLRDALGNVSGLCGMTAEITESKRVHDKLREQAQLLDEATDAILVRDLNHRILYWNRGAERIYGWKSEEVLGRSVVELLYDLSAAFAVATAEVLERGDWRGEIEQFTRSRRPLLIDAHWTLLRDEQGRPKSILSINSDRTERKKLEQQFIRAQRMESVGTLADGIAHDLNNVFAPILMSLAVLRLRTDDHLSREMLTTITTCAQHGADMVRQVLSFARGVTGERIEVQLGHLVREVERTANDTFLKHVQVRTKLAPDLWTVLGDPVQLQQVLLNLCVNARDAMPAGGTLNLRAQNVVVDALTSASDTDLPPGRYVCLQVEDNGTGIAPAALERIFEPFFTTKEVGQGTGLGLATALAIVKSHQGRFKVESKLGAGSTFSIFLPACSEEATELAAASHLQRGERELILVIDDEEAFRQITKHTLESYGYRVALASDGAEGLAIIASRRSEISAVLTDMMMPGMSGPTVIRVLQKLAPGIPIIATSGVAAPERGYASIPAGTERFLPKPFGAAALLKTLAEVLGR